MLVSTQHTSEGAGSCNCRTAPSLLLTGEFRLPPTGVGRCDLLGERAKREIGSKKAILAAVLRTTSRLASPIIMILLVRRSERIRVSTRWCEEAPTLGTRIER